MSELGDDGQDKTRVHTYAKYGRGKRYFRLLGSLVHLSG